MKLFHFLFASVLIAQPILLSAQPHRANPERMEALRIAFITEELALTPEESKAFWPLHEAFETQMTSQRESLMRQQESFAASTASEKEFQAHVENLAEQRKAMVDLETAHLLEVAQLLGAERALQLPDMKRKLSRQIRERMASPQQRGPQGARQSIQQRPSRGAGRH